MKKSLAEKIRLNILKKFLQNMSSNKENLTQELEK